MADDSLNLEVVLSARTQGLKDAEREASLVQDAVESLSRAGQVGERTLNAYSKTTERLEKSFGGAASGAQKMAGTFETVRSEILELDRRLQSAAETALSFGSQNIFGDAVQNARMTGEEARKVADYYEAIEVNARSAAKAINDAAEASARVSRNAQLGNQSAARNQASARAGGLFAQGQLYDTGSALKASETSWAREAKLAQETGKVLEQNMANITRRFKEERDKQLSDAQKNNALEVKSAKDAREQELASLRQVIQVRSREQSQGLAAAQDTDRLNEQARAAELAALKQQILSRSTRTATEEISRQEVHLPRLRYALHDVSNQLLVIGGAMTAFSVLAFKSAIDYERSFANVIRTNDSLMNSQVAANRMFQEFIDLAGEIPTSFGDLSEIGALAGQLNIPTHALRGFTEAVAMFSATTGESIDTTATAFGRLDALLPGVEGNFQALGSSILNVGINSVATEGEIISITTQLAGIGSQAGLTYDELVGLSGALASVGIQPELSRGTITRLFGQISRAVTLGGERLQEFGKIAGSTGDQFASKWSSEPMQAVVDVLQGLNTRGGEAEAALRAVGVTSVRDVPAILRLAQTVDTILVPALGDAADGANEATQLAENYGVIAETVASKLQILANNFQSLMAAAGDSNGVFSVALDIINDLLTATRKLLDNPVTAFFVQGAVAATALSGIVLVLLAGVTRAAAGVLAFRTAMSEAGVRATGLRAQLTGLIGAISGVDAASVKASGNMSRLTGVMRGVGIASVALIAVPLINWIDGVASEARGAVVDVDTLSKSLSMLGTGDGATSSSISDVISKSLSSLGSSTQGASFWETTNIFSQTEGFWRRTMTAAETEYDAGLQRLTMKTSSWLTTDLFTGENSWLASFLDPSIAQVEQFEEAWIRAWETASSESQKQEILNALNELKAGLSPEEIEAFEYNLRNLYDVMGSGVDATALLGEQTAATNEEFESLQETLQAIVDEVFAGVNAQAALSGAMLDLGGDFINVGAAAAFSGDSMQAAISQIVEQSGTAGAAAANLQVLYDFILKNSSATAGELIYLANAIALMNAQAGGKKSAPSMLATDFQSFAIGADKARASLQRTNRSLGGTAKAAKEARVELRTLLDYANDLSSVWSRAFDIRFGGMQGLDAIRSTFLSIREAADEAAKRIRDLKNDISGLSSDIDIQEYFLSIAVEYGDSKRAAAIEADLAKKRADLSDKTKELQEQQDAASMSLVGTTKGAIENRQEILGLVGQYQSYIQALAASGISQGALTAKTRQLQAEFIAQATALGYNRSELRQFEMVFSDIARTINAVPFAVTTDLSSLDPASLAIKEFVDKANANLNTLGNGVGGALGGALGAVPAEVEPIAADSGTKVATRYSDAYDLYTSKKLPAYTKEATDKAGKEALPAGARWGGGLASSLGGRYGSEAKRQLSEGTMGALNWSAQTNASTARALGSSLASGLRWGMSSAFDWMFQSSPAVRGFVRNLTGFESGGFTGRGGSSDVAGIVHKGEYVIPQNMVNQSSGMPYADALGRLMGGLPSRATAPASSAGSSGQSGVFITGFSAGALQGLEQATGKQIVLNGQVIADSSANVYSEETTVGAY